LQSVPIRTAHRLAGSGIRRVLLLTAQLLALALIFASAAPAEEYRLGVQDKLKIRVVEWQTIEGTFREWDGVSGEYTVGASGDLSLPLIGETPAAGKTTAEVAASVSEALQQKFGLSTKPEASVELAEYRPFFIAGDVQTPGQYPYIPGLTVVKAVSIAGGVKRSGVQRAERDFINAKGSHDVAAEERLRLLVKRARLVAEAEGDAEIEPPEELAANPDLPKILAEEAAIRSARQKKLKLQLEAIDNLKKLLEGEIASLEKKVATQQRQVDLAKKELEDVGSLADKGLVVNQRILGTERTIAEMEGKLLDHQTAILRAKQDISEAEQNAIDLKNTVDADIAIERQQVEAALVEATLKVNMNRGLMAEALTWAPAAAVAMEPAAETFIIVRSIDNQTQEIEASENTPVLPGDVLKVKVKILPEEQESAGQ
jgi:polysaccharide biosynthesis/export protein ExoF